MHVLYERFTINIIILSMLKDNYGKNIIMLSILKDNFGIMYVFLSSVLYCRHCIYELYCFHMGFIAFWTCSIKTYLLTYLLINLEITSSHD